MTLLEADEEFNAGFVFEDEDAARWVPKRKEPVQSTNVIDQIVKRRKEEQKRSGADKEECEAEEDLDRVDSEDDEDGEESEDDERDEGDEGDEDEDEKDKEQSDYSNDSEQKASFFDESLPIAEPSLSFASMNLSRPIMKGLNALNFSKPTRIQAAAIPLALQGKDICGGAVTGSGKTAAFIVPVVERLLFRSRQSQLSRVLILLPTRELAVQCFEVAKAIAKFTDIRICLAAGGLPLQSQVLELKKRPDIIVATPGRLIDHLQNSPSFSLDSVEILILDEADRMLEIGFSDELDEIIRACPKSRQTMLFSATMTDKVDQLVRLSLNKPAKLFVDTTNSTSANLVQEFVRIRKETDRIAVVLALCTRSFKKRCIIFVPSKTLAHELKIIFALMDLSACELHGNLAQAQRLESLELFRNGQCNFLLATDLAARGLDISGIETVINYSMPSDYRQYLHRVGRTARAGLDGRSVTLIGESDRKVLKQALKHTQTKPLQRTVPSLVIANLRDSVEAVASEIQAVLAEERDEKLLKTAEMEASKAENMVIHKKDILSKPKRTWFQSSRAKKDSKNKDRKAFHTGK